jgi:hypothetical protein
LASPPPVLDIARDPRSGRVEESCPRRRWSAAGAYAVRPHYTPRVTPQAGAGEEMVQVHAHDQVAADTERIPPEANRLMPDEGTVNTIASAIIARAQLRVRRLR